MYKTTMISLFARCGQWGGFVQPPAVRFVYLYSYIRIASAISAASF